MNECCLCGTSVAMRTLYRTRYNIPVSDAPVEAKSAAASWVLGCALGQGERGVPEGESIGGELHGHPDRQGAGDVFASLL